MLEIRKLEVPARTSIVIVCSAAFFGLLVDQLIRVPVGGVNVPLGFATLAAAGLALPAAAAPVNPGSLFERSPWGWLAGFFFAAMWAVRDAELLLAVDLMAALALFSLPMLQARGVRLRSVDLAPMLLALPRAAWQSTFGTLDFAHSLRSYAFPGGESARRAKTIAAGLVLAAPLVFVFGSLFASADPVFRAAVTSVFGIDLGPLASHVFLAGAFAWASAGYLWALAKPAHESAMPFRVPTMGGIQVFTPLTATAIVFALFLAVQAGNLFGGQAFVEARSGLTYAEYARGGFFQLMVASGLVLPLVYIAPLAAGPLDEQRSRTLRGLLATQLILTALVLASAMWRMGLYMRVYGLSEDRIYGTTAMAWIGATLAVLSATVLRGRQQGAAFGSLIAAIAVLATLNLINPKALIARYNLDHQNGREIDVAHLERLGGDAVPVLAARLESIPPAARCAVVQALVAEYREPKGDWRSWNVARARARDAARTLDVVAVCGDPPYKLVP